MKKLTVVLLTGMLLCSLSSNAFCWEHYHYRGGHYYRHAGWWDFGALATGLAVGAYVASLPPSYETVVINGTPYYYADGYYYQSGPNGYVVAEPPAGADQSSPAPGGNNILIDILGTLVAILLLVSIGLLLKKLFRREGKTA